jgi:hypothetical protein
MHRFKLIVMAFMLMALFGAVTSSVASAEITLPEFTVETKATSTSGKSEFAVEGSSIKCGSGTGEFIPTSKKLGIFTISFKECKGPATVGRCWSLGDPKGEILFGGEWHLVIILPNGTILIWILLSHEDKEVGGLKPLHLECEKVLALSLLWGCFLLVITPDDKTTKEFSFDAEREGETDRITRFDNNEGKEVEAEGLKGSVDGGATRSVGWESRTNSLITEKETEIKE